MPIICFEGASAVGKTTTAKSFNEYYSAYVVPEVNELFTRPENESADWYFERQVERWTIAREQSKFYQLVILDGDPFQPLWYNWAYDFAGWQDLDFMERFYQPRIRDKTICFPDLYFIFSADEPELRRRKTGDSSRQRSGFEKHLKMIEPQRRYFQAICDLSTNQVCFLETQTIASNIEFVRERVFNSSIENKKSGSEILFAEIIQWLRENPAQYDKTSDQKH